MKHEALYYDKKDNKVLCVLCPRKCVIKDGGIGFCRVRKNEGGKLYSLVYGNPVAVHVDPIEKKPLFHFMPGKKVFSFGTAGCTLRCKHCQNWEISQTGADSLPEQDMPPKKVVELAIEAGCDMIASTYNEPFVFYEFMLDTAKLARKAGLKNVLVSNGFIMPEPLKEAMPYIDAINVDLKGITQKFYGSTTASMLKPVQETIRTLAKSKVHLEITNLIIPTLNDSEKELRELAKWVHDNAGSDVPLHFSAFFPHFELGHLPPTPAETLFKAREMAKEEGMKFVYLGNLHTGDGENTNCPKCGELLIDRIGYTVKKNIIKEGKCPKCGETIHGVFL